MWRLLQPVAASLTGARPSYVLLTVGLYALSVPLGAWRWRTVLRGLDREAPFGRLVLTNLAAIFVNNMTPSSRLAGEACRVVSLVRARIAVASTAVASLVYERVSEAPVVGALVVVAMTVAGRGASKLPGAAGWIAIAIGLCVAVAVFARALPWMRAKLRDAPGLLAWRVYAAAVAGSTGIWILDVMRLRSAAAAVGSDVSLAQAATLAAITIAAGLVPSVGGLGVVEGGLAAGLIAFGVAPADAAAITAIERGISYVLASIAGAVALSALGGRELYAAVRTAAGRGEARA